MVVVETAIRFRDRKHENPDPFGVFVIALATAGVQSPSVNNEAFPPAAVVFTVTVFSVVNRGR